MISIGRYRTIQDNIYDTLESKIVDECNLSDFSGSHNKRKM